MKNVAQDRECAVSHDNFRHSSVLSLPGVLLHKVLSGNIVKVAVKIMSRRQKKTDDNLFFTITEAPIWLIAGLK